MFKFIKAFLRKEPNLNQIDLPIENEIHPLDWINELQGNSRFKTDKLKKEDYIFIGEPVLTLIESLRKNNQRFKIKFIRLSEYLDYIHKNNRHTEVYPWMMKPDHKNGIGYNLHFGLFKDKKSGVCKSFVISDHKIYRIDDIDFKLNHWELKALKLAFITSKQESVKRKQRFKDFIFNRDMQREKEIENIERMKYAKIFS